MNFEVYKNSGNFVLIQTKILNNVVLANSN